jgi:hypothetical protein
MESGNCWEELGNRMNYEMDIVEQCDDVFHVMNF